jgi:hypothetical protein
MIAGAVLATEIIQDLPGTGIAGNLGWFVGFWAVKPSKIYPRRT